MKAFKKGADVTWKWGSSEASGKVVETYTEKVTREIKGKEITRNASRDEPAYLIEQDDGDEVLKSHSELSAD
ncbi:MAG: DUF2945 domain-containing protein [Chitinophagales bacterium]|nr:DUF2945 domain-containing protein [Hyphomicrobiales bacterium]